MLVPSCLFYLLCRGRRPRRPARVPLPAVFQNKKDTLWVVYRIAGEEFSIEALPVADKARWKKGSVSRFSCPRECRRGSLGDYRRRHALDLPNSPPDCLAHAYGVTGLFEPLPAVYQKQNTTRWVVFCFWSGRRGSNSLPRPWQGRALPDELRPQNRVDYIV